MSETETRSLAELQAQLGEGVPAFLPEPDRSRAQAAPEAHSSRALSETVRRTLASVAARLVVTAVAITTAATLPPHRIHWPFWSDHPTADDTVITADSEQPTVDRV